MGANNKDIRVIKNIAPVLLTWCFCSDLAPLLKIMRFLYLGKSSGFFSQIHPLLFPSEAALFLAQGGVTGVRAMFQQLRKADFCARDIREEQGVSVKQENENRKSI